ncbi:MAG: AMP-binding protein [Smithellaceae bacterium]
MPSCGIGQVIKDLAHADPAAVAVVSSKYNPLTYSQLVWQIDHVAATMSKSGLGNSARIAIAVKDTAPAALAIVAVACFSTAVPLDPNLAPAEIALRLKLLDVDAVLVLAGEQTACRTLANEQGIALIELKQKEHRDLLFLMSDPKIQRKNRLNPPTMDHAAVIFQTSGTSAEPKFVPCTHAGLLTAAKQAVSWFCLNKKDRCLSIAPPYYSHGLTLTILAPLLSGGSVAFPLKLTDLNLSEWFEALRPTWYSTSPTIHLAISEKLAASSSRLTHRLRLAGSGGSPLPESVRSRLEQALGIPVLEHYGMTEASQITTNLPPPGPSKPGTVGIPSAGTVMIATPDGKSMPTGQRGEIWVRGANVTTEYCNGPSLNQSAFVNGWFRTGDIGSLDEEGFLTLHGRIKELINRGGEKISPFEVEAAILKHPAVEEAVAFALPHPRLGEDVGLALVLRPGGMLDISEFRRFMSDSISWNKIPRRIHVLESIPKGLGGKALRRKLRERYA